MRASTGTPCNMDEHEDLSNNPARNRKNQGSEEEEAG